LRDGNISVAVGLLQYTVSQKVPTFKLSETSSNLNRFSKFLHCWKSHEICYKTRTTLPTSCMLLHYLWKLQIQIFPDVEENANKLHF